MMDVGNVHPMPDYGDAQVINEAFVESITAAKHECPPDRVAMMARLEEIQKAFDTRLANQRQVIENLDAARKAAVDHLTGWQEFGRYLAHDYTGDYDVSVKATELLRQQGTE